MSLITTVDWSWKARLGTEGGTEHIIFLTGPRFRFYLSVHAFGRRLRVRGYREGEPVFWFGRA